jgi:hypothetical protein
MYLASAVCMATLWVYYITRQTLSGRLPWSEHLFGSAGPCPWIAPGLQDLTQVGRNVCRVLQLCGRTDIPVYLGAGEPLVAEHLPPNFWFGHDGLGDAPSVSHKQLC